MEIVTSQSLFYSTLEYDNLNWMNPARIYLFKVNNRNARRRCEICSKLTIKTPDDVIGSSVSIVNFEHIIAGWE